MKFLALLIGVIFLAGWPGVPLASLVDATYAPGQIPDPAGSHPPSGLHYIIDTNAGLVAEPFGYIQDEDWPLWGNHSAWLPWSDARDITGQVL